MAIKFSDRVFGANVEKKIIDIFDNLQKGSFDQKPLSETAPSPYQDMLDSILSENDDSTRYEYILRFSKNYTREATINENTYWNYCIETNIELLLFINVVPG